MVLHADAPPAWLASDSPHGDVALSSRVRYARNLQGRKFPHRMEKGELLDAQRTITKAFSGSGLEVLKHLAPAERDYWLGCRLISPEFEWQAPGRSVLVNEDRSLSIMVNEEDHVRLQAVTAGWSLDTAQALADHALDHFARRVEFAWSPEFGYLTTSPYNAGTGRRLSAMFHLIALAHSKRLPQVLKALMARGLSARGLFGESSRAVGAFVQVSQTEGPRSDFTGAVEYIMTQERSARSDVGRSGLVERFEATREYVIQSSKLDLADSVRILGWMRWAAVAGLPGVASPRKVDLWLSTLELGSLAETEKSARLRADFLRSCFESG